jgi:hypothetical protein
MQVQGISQRIMKRIELQEFLFLSRPSPAHLFVLFTIPNQIPLLESTKPRGL